MTTVSATKTITNVEYQTLASLADITMTSGKSYSIQIQGIIGYKVADAAFTFENRDFTFTQGTDAVYVKSFGLPATIVVLENT